MLRAARATPSIMPAGLPRNLAAILRKPTTGIVFYLVGFDLLGHVHDHEAGDDEEDNEQDETDRDLGDPVPDALDGVHRAITDPVDDGTTTRDTGQPQLGLAEHRQVIGGRNG